MDIKHLYSFSAEFEDGTIITQDHTVEGDDLSLTRADGTGSRFTDVQEKEKDSKLIGFVIHNDGQSLGVDLRDGHFELNGTPFWQHRPELDGYKDFRVIYFRTVEHQMSPDGTQLGGDVKSYTVGWQVTDDSGKNVQKTVTI